VPFTLNPHIIGDGGYPVNPLQFSLR